MRRAFDLRLRPDKRTGYFYPNQSQAIFLAQPAFKKLRIISQTNYLTVVYLLVKPKNLNLSLKNLRFLPALVTRAGKRKQKFSSVCLQAS